MILGRLGMQSFTIDESTDPMTEIWGPIIQSETGFLLIVRTGRIVTVHARAP